MSTSCSTCGSEQRASVRFPGHDTIEAIICITCGTPQPKTATSAPSKSDRAT